MYAISDLHYQPKKETVVIPTRIGQEFEGGYLAGVIRVKDSAYLILVAPKSTEGSVQFKTQLSSTPGTQLVNNGWSNSRSMDDTDHPAAHFCRNLKVNGQTDLYLPSRDELELCYRNLKPTTNNNRVYAAGTYTSNLSLANGTNLSSIPSGSAYTKTDPALTIVTAFQTGSVEAFSPYWYWTSTESSSDTNDSLLQGFAHGNQVWYDKTTVVRVRGVRRVPILIDKE